MNAIPKEILIHSCTLKIYGKDGIFGSKQLLSETNLSNVRLSVRRRVFSGTDGVRHGTEGTLYYDCENSLPADAEFLRDSCESIVTFKGMEFRVTKIKYIYSGDSLHHLEIELGGAA